MIRWREIGDIIKGNHSQEDKGDTARAQMFKLIKEKEGHFF